jgi:oxygen-dependent protoporphyrinogen oxidase
MGFLPETLAAHIGEDVMTGCANLRVEIDADKAGSHRASRFVVSFERAGNAESFACYSVVIAAPSSAAAALVAPLSDELGRLLGEITYPPLSIVYLAYEASSIKTPLDGFGFLAAPSEGLKILGCVWNTSLFRGRAPEGKALLTAFIGGARNPDAARLNDAEMIAAAHGELQKILGITSEPQAVSITRWERAIPQYNLGHYARVQRIESLLGELHGLSLLGNYLHGVSTGDCIKEADRVAREVARSVGQ